MADSVQSARARDHADAQGRRWFGRRSSGVAMPLVGPTAGAPTTAPARRVTHPSVLVVDDNPLNLMLARELFACWGIEPLVAVDGAEAVTLAAALRLHLILMDLQMPVLDGLSATREIRRLEQEQMRPRVPIVAYSSSAPRLATLHAFGIDGVLDKPCTADALQLCLMQWCTPSDGDAAPLPWAAGRAVR